MTLSIYEITNTHDAWYAWNNLEAVDSDPIQKPRRNLHAGTEKKTWEASRNSLYITLDSNGAIINTPL